MSAFMMSEQMLMQSQHYNRGYHQQLLMQAAMCNYQEPQVAIPSPTESLDCEVELLNKEMWKQFHDLGTEMIITKNGRRMFPSLSVQVKGLKPGEQYAVAVEMWPVGGARWRRAGGVWAAGGQGGPGGQGVPGGTGGGGRAGAPHGAALHPDGPAPATRWSQPINFNRLKLTNNVHDSAGNIVLTSMCKYQPRIRVMRVGGGWPAERCFTFPETEFIAVTAYQNEEITQLKINNNPFAKGFRKCGQGKCKRKMRSPSPDTENCSEGPSSPKIRITDSPTGTSTSSESSANKRMNSPAASTSSYSSSSNRSDGSPRTVTEDNPILDLAQRRSMQVLSYPVYDEGQITETSSARSSIRSPMRSPSSSSESSCHLSVSSRHEEVPQSNQSADMRYLQLAEWAHYMMYSNPLWMPPSHGYPTPLQAHPHPHLWHQPSPLNPPTRSTPPAPLTPPTPPTPACRPRDQPKGSSFTIRALIGDN